MITHTCGSSLYIKLMLDGLIAQIGETIVGDTIQYRPADTLTHGLKITYSNNLYCPSCNSEVRDRSELCVKCAKCGEVSKLNTMVILSNRVTRPVIVHEKCSGVYISYIKNHINPNVDIEIIPVAKVEAKYE